MSLRSIHLSRRSVASERILMWISECVHNKNLKANVLAVDDLLYWLSRQNRVSKANSSERFERSDNLNPASRSWIRWCYGRGRGCRFEGSPREIWGEAASFGSRPLEDRRGSLCCRATIPYRDSSVHAGQNEYRQGRSTCRGEALPLGEPRCGAAVAPRLSGTKSPDDRSPLGGRVPAFPGRQCRTAAHVPGRQPQ